MDITREQLPAAEADRPAAPLRIGARIISVLFHPLFIPVYIGWFLIYILHQFPNLDAWRKTLLLIQFFVSYTLLPLATMLLAKALGFVDTIYLRTQKDRIIPYIACGVFYFWIWYVFRNQAFSKEVTAFSLAVFVASSLGLILNSYFKISMHGLAVGVMVTYVFLMAFASGISFGFYMSVALLITGVVCTARLINSDHGPFEVYAGLLMGIIAQLFAWWVTV